MSQKTKVLRVESFKLIWILQKDSIWEKGKKNEKKKDKKIYPWDFCCLIYTIDSYLIGIPLLVVLANEYTFVL